MSDLNDLSKPTPTDTEPNVLDTLRAHIIRAATWSGWGATGNKVAGIMSAVTAVVSGGRSLRLYRRNDANTSDEEIVSLPGVSIGGNAATVSNGSVTTAKFAANAKAPLAGTSDTVADGAVTTAKFAANAKSPLAGTSDTVADGAVTTAKFAANAKSPLAGTSDTVVDSAVTTAKFAANAKAPLAGTADAVAWTGVSGRPTAVSAFTNDAGYLTSATAPTPNTTNVLAATAGAAVGAVGSYALLAPASNNSYAPGSTLAGSSLRYFSAAGYLVYSEGYLYPGASTSSSLGAAPSGTWRCMGHSASTAAPGSSGGTLWLRIA